MRTTVLKVLRVVVGLSKQLAHQQLQNGVKIDGKEFQQDVEINLSNASRVTAGETNIKVIPPHLKNLGRKWEWNAEQ